MTWEQLLSARRLGSAEKPNSYADARSQFQRDYDRLIFSSPFRRLQNKTQVFPLPGGIFVHNRLTHSLEVASVGRSLGNMLSARLVKQQEADQELVSELGSIVSAACLAHDLGNPAFGHSGEKAISRYFTHGEGGKLHTQMNDVQWKDVTTFEGNANALRILTHTFHGKGNGSYALTFSTLASIVKYPCESIAGGKKGELHRKKYGFFETEKETFLTIANELGMVKSNSDPVIYQRHPLVYLVEAADDICYSVVDLEDAHRLRILDENIVNELLLGIIEAGSPGANQDRVHTQLQELLDANDRVGYLRAKAIAVLINACFEAFWGNRQAIMAGDYNKSLTDSLTEPLLAVLDRIAALSVKKIYNHPSVVEIELAGYKVMSGLLEEFVPAVMDPDNTYYRKLVELMPIQYRTTSEEPYHKVQTALDFVSGMTDIYAVELYRKLKGISLPGLR
jgi:dGTPase